MHCCNGLGQWDAAGAYDTQQTVGIGPDQVPPGDFSGDFMTYLPQAVSAIAAWDMQRKMVDMNIERVRQGLPPIDPSQVAPGVNVGLTPQTQQLATVALIGMGAIALFAIARRR
jgi:hypothetical protein